MTPTIIVQCAKILLLKADGRSNDSVVDELGINKRTVLLWTKKYRNRSSNETLDDILSVSGGRGLKEEISGEAGYQRLTTISESLNGRYPQGDRIRLILDNLKVHTSAGV